MSGEAETISGEHAAEAYWLTCTPKHFVGDAAHMARDTGLLSTGFCMSGCRSRPMLPGPACAEDDPRILRVDPPRRMWETDYWRSLGADGVVLYAWGMPQYSGIARAIRQAGLRLVVHLDSAGLMSPLVDGWTYSKLVYQRHRMESGALFGWAKATLSVGRSMIPRVMDLPRLEHMSEGHVIGAVSPLACERIERFARHYGRDDVARKVRLVLHPISPHMCWGGERKERRICIVGRWLKKDWVKNPWLLMATLRLALAKHPDHEAVVVGGIDGFMERMWHGLPGAVRRRVHLTGRLPNEEVAAIYRGSRIALCTSFSEGFHTSSAEALCCGASVVGYESPYLPNLPYYAGENSGTIADAGTGESMAAAVGREIGEWESGRRDPAAIAGTWGERLHAHRVAAKILELTAGCVGLCLSVLWLCLGGAASGAVDADSDGMSDVWRACWPEGDLPPAGDADGDGISNRDESVMGTNPLDRASQARIDLIEPHPDSPVLSWRSVPGRLYQAEWLVEAGWQACGPMVAGTGGQVQTVLPPHPLGTRLVRLRAFVDQDGAVGRFAGDDTVDTDGDGQGDLAEFLAGTDPLDSRSRFEIDGLFRSDAVILGWPAEPGKLYQVEHSTAPAGSAWTKLGSPLAGDRGRATACHALEPGSDRGFFRLAVEDRDTDGDGVTDWEEQVLGSDPARPADTTWPAPAVDAVVGAGLSEGTAIVSRGESGGVRLTRQGRLGPLAVKLEVSGDARPGEDYLPLPREVRFGTGQRVVEIPVVPLGRPLDAAARTVVVTLVPGSGYAVGGLGRADVRLLEERRLSVRDYGAAGDGVADDTAAIQAAILALEKSRDLNTLWFPAGDYKVATITPQNLTTGGSYRLLELGGTTSGVSLIGRDFVIAGEPGARLYSVTSPNRAHILLVRARFRSLSLRDMRFEKDRQPLFVWPPGSEPNGADGVAVVDYYGQKMASVGVADCEFVNCHPAIRTYHNGHDLHGNLSVFSMRRSKVLNPYGSNTLTVFTAYGGGQQVLLTPWVRYANYEGNEFNGSTDGAIDEQWNPGRTPKDGSHLGSPLELRFVNNVVRNMGVEAVFQVNDPLMGYVVAPFTVPAGGGTVAVAVDSRLSTYVAGQVLNFRFWPGGGATAVNVSLTVAASDPVQRLVTVRNDGMSAQAVAGLAVSTGTPIFLQNGEPTLAEIRANLVDGATSMGIAVNARSVVSDNIVRGCGVGIQVFEEARAPLWPAARGSRIIRNLIMTGEGDSGDSFRYGIQSWGPEETIVDNTVVVPRSVKVTGICPRGEGAWLLDNRVEALQVVRNGYESPQRAVGIGIGNSATLTRVRGNRSKGFDVGLGPAQPFQSIPYRLWSHDSADDALAVDPRGVIWEEP